MSEPLLNAILRLFALVAKEDLVTKQERDHIQHFLEDHLSEQAVASHLLLFDKYCNQIAANMTPQQEAKAIAEICSEINQEVAQKQKAVIMIELMSIIVSDGAISSHEDFLAKSIGAGLNVNSEDIVLIETYLLGKNDLE